MSRRNFKVRCCSLVAIVSSCTSAFSYAESLEIDERITVTATRQPLAITQVDSSVSIIDASEIEEVGHQHINQIFHTVPGGWISRGNGQEHLTAIRSPVFTGAGGCGAFLFAQDGISLRAPGFCNANQLFDVNSEQANRIEVIRGPNSVFYGSNAVHGLINIMTADVENVQNSVSADVGGYGFHRLKGTFSQGTSEAGFALLANITDDDGYQNDSGFNQQKVDLIHQQSVGRWQVKNVVSYANLDQETAGFIQGELSYKDDAMRRVNLNPEAFRESKSFRAHSQWQTELEQGVFKLTPYVRWTDMRFLQHYLPWQALEENSQQSIGVQGQYEKHFTGVEFISGIDVDLTNGELTEFQADDFSPTIPQGLHYDYDVDATLISPFVHTKWRIAENTQLSVGARFDMTKYDYDNHLTDGDVCEVDVENCRFTRPSDQTVDFEQWSWRVGLLHSITPNQTIFSNLSSGFRAPQTTELFRLQSGQEIANLEAEEVLSVELGWKASWQGFQAEAVAYQMEKENVIFQDTQRQNISEGKTMHTGLEFNFRAALADNVQLDGNLGWGRHTYKSDLTLSNINIEGNYIDTAPKVLAGARIHWQAMASLNFRLEWTHMDEYYLDPENTATYAGHDLFNLHSSWQMNDNISLALRLNNLTDRDYAERADIAFGNYRYFVGLPRTLFASITIGL
ncbi:TonB-dependent receptor [Aliiglaciecola sp. 3_MG-2023]|uniref:TonB-dependent receptor n=1 Tax=Aliiglaciecola sp. 3_MG-2023 TaxID=3062644 RepID=UPI0026E46239|nr:TonB-dependent receptor [Aliiglaciecola sp. 3_MG-2023]MDO6695235.1 TonB-dependent receptor [Aliiglaciecola sp. 3_MG-2023]